MLAHKIKDVIQNKVGKLALMKKDKTCGNWCHQLKDVTNIGLRPNDCGYWNKNELFKENNDPNFIPRSFMTSI